MLDIFHGCVQYPGQGRVTDGPSSQIRGRGDYLRRVKTENGLSDCQLRVSSPSRCRICCCHLKQFYFLETLNTVNTNLEPASVATLAFLTQVVFEYGNCQELPGLEPIHFCGSQLMLLTAIIEMLRLLTPRRMTVYEDLSSQFPGRRILTLARAWAGQPGVVGSWRDVNT